ncbi:serine/threonine protein phosphatase 2A regulatory subunit B''alpha-like [Amborella trichopoda]|uniref:serine/threonine protein phosphatase 2A regulatory subunit B''alpha-like n=1 Tax=Amborella trichopoda TaxID=13333 RepID=UPI0009BD6D85|nr:serine/threonine protein phosphatase 2A regulatory subunit B''alpha-like [Amborella trichopoda]|eukprot:XP_020530992.1 serine/threonine protein phosphatase 2A regulatory subunit B''alpha-like [Amborella trichopoda]
MDMEVSGDVGSIDPDLLQLAEVSPLALKSNRDLIDELYSQWLSLPDTSRLVKSLLDEAKSSTPLNVPGNSSSANATASNSLPSMFPAGSAPPLSPRSSSGSPRVMKRSVGPSSLGSPLKLVSEPVREVIPQLLDALYIFVLEASIGVFLGYCIQ